MSSLHENTNSSFWSFSAFHSLFSLSCFVFLWHWSPLQPSLCLSVAPVIQGTNQICMLWVYEWGGNKELHETLSVYLGFTVPEKPAPNFSLANGGDEDVGGSQLQAYKSFMWASCLHCGTPYSFLDIKHLCFPFSRNKKEVHQYSDRMISYTLVLRREINLRLWMSFVLFIAFVTQGLIL